MKKIIFFLLVAISTTVFSQEQSINIVYYKVKMGQRASLYKAMSEYNAKFRPAGSPYAVITYNLVGGEHNGELLILSNIGKSFTERDMAAPMPKDMQNELYTTIHSYMESISGGDVLVYKKEYSNSAFSDRTDKVLTTVYHLKYSVDAKFWDVVKKLPKAWEKAGLKIAVYTPLTGTSRLIFSRRMVNGWSELDENKNLAIAYDEVYGKGSYDKDILIFRAGVERKDVTMQTKNNDLSSK